MAKWTGKIQRSLRLWIKPRITDTIYLHFSEILKSVKHYAPFIKGRVLDVGCGKSPYRSLFTNAEEYIRLDYSDYDEGIDIKADITKEIPLENNSIDNVVCFQVLEHVNKPQKAIDEIHRILKKDGCCLLTTHMASALHGEPHDYYRFTKYALKDLFKKFKHVEIKPQGGAVLSVIQLINWGLARKLPKIIARPIIALFNLIGKPLDKILYDPVFTINYGVFAVK